MLRKLWSRRSTGIDIIQAESRFMFSWKREGRRCTCDILNGWHFSTVGCAANGLACKVRDAKDRIVERASIFISCLFIFLQWVRQLNCVRTEIYPLSRKLLGDNPERLFLGKLRSGSIPDLSFSTLVA